MAELFEGDEPDADAAAIAADSAAIDLALKRAGKGRKGDALADRFLARQDQLAAKQLHHLDEQFRHLRLKHFSDRLRVTIQLMTIGLGVAVVAALAWMAIDASRAEGVVIKPFAVAPDLARRGVTGEVVASQLLDKLTGITERARLGRTTGRFAAGWGQSVAIQIPETGVSLAEVDRFLRERLGHEQALTGEVVQNPDGTVTLTARLDGRSLPPQTGAPADLPQLLQRQAEALYRREQPMAYAGYLFQFAPARNEELAEVGRELTDSHNPLERASGYAALGMVDTWRDNVPAAMRDYEASLAENANLSWPLINMSSLEGQKGHQEEALRLDRQHLALIPRDPGVTPQGALQQTLTTEYDIAFRLHDHATALEKSIALRQGDNLGSILSRAALKLYVAGDRANVHDGLRAETEAQAFVPRSPFDAKLQAQTLAYIARSRGDFASFLTRADFADKMPPVFPISLGEKADRAGALAYLGRIVEAHAMIDATPLDCQSCIVARGVVANAEGKFAEADHWFAEASRIGPSTANGPLYWGEALLKRGDAARAAAQYREVLRRSPRAEEAMVGLGEALIAQDDATGAVKQFAAANALTPKWGRLHLKWGEAQA